MGQPEAGQPEPADDLHQQRRYPDALVELFELAYRLHIAATQGTRQHTEQQYQMPANPDTGAQ